MAEQPHVEAAKNYAQAIYDQKMPGCYWVQLACARFLNDLDKTNWPYTFDPAKAGRVCKFIEQMPHVKGQWALRRETIKLEPWQSFILVNTFGFVHKDTGFRRFNKSQTIVPRKNAKTTIGAGIGLYMLTADNEYGAEVYCGATSEKQALEVFRPAQDMARKTPAFTKHFGVQVNASNIHVQRTSSRFEPIIGKPGDGASPSCAIIDEFHEHDTADLYNTMQTGMGAREQPLMLVITTAGDNSAGPGFDMVLQGRKLLEGTIQDDSTFYIEYTIDEGMDWADPSSLEMANPNIGVSVKREFLLASQQEAIRNPRKAGIFRTKHLNQWIQSKSAYFNIYHWNNNYVPEDELERLIEDKPCYIGMDLASKQDICANVQLFPLGDGRFALKHRFYLPEQVVDMPGKDAYQAWVSEGTLLTHPGNMTDDAEIKADLDDLRKLYDVKKIAFDPSNARWMMSALLNEGADVIEVTQSSLHLSEPMRRLAGLIDDGKLLHSCLPHSPMSWMMSNVVSKTTRRDLDFPEKERPENKIDGPVALIIAMSQCLVEDNWQSVYETESIFVL